MPFYYAIPLVLGVMVVLQGGMNRHLGSLWGLSTAVFLNAAVLFLLSALFYGMLRWSPESFPEFLRPRASETPPAWWYLIPGLCGFCMILGLPWAMHSIGAAKSFILLITAQICAGLVWDFAISGVSPSLWKLLGGAFTLLGSLLVIFG